MKRVFSILLVIPFVIIAGLALAWGFGELQLRLKEFPLATQPPDWALLGQEQYPSIVTKDADGGRRITTLWIATVHNEAYLRTDDSIWLGNLGRAPELELRIGGLTYICSTSLVDSDTTVAQVHSAFREKYAKRSALFRVLGVSTNTVISLDCGEQEARS